MIVYVSNRDIGLEIEVFNLHSPLKERTSHKTLVPQSSSAGTANQFPRKDQIAPNDNVHTALPGSKTFSVGILLK